VVGLLVVVAAVWAGPVLRDFWRAGFFSKAPEKRTLHADTENNLNALYTAMKLHHDSEGVFPKSDTWMDKVIKRVRTEDIKKGEEKKKFIDPAAGGAPGVYGFAMNDAASDKYIDDIKDKKAPIVFESTETNWNAHGDPAKIGRKGGIGMAVDGTVVRL
jgi:hypothetical protein